MSIAGLHGRAGPLPDPAESGDGKPLNAMSRGAEIAERLGKLHPYLDDDGLLELGRLLDDTRARVEKLEAALREIIECRAQFSADHLEHCRNAVEFVREVAARALAETGGTDE